GRRRQGQDKGAPQGSGGRPDRRQVPQERGQGRPGERGRQGRRRRRRRQGQGHRQSRRAPL
ncbi:MAG: hypothetical protein AVDCRST_MAG65-521, partial [uncultured Solirubrobacteraceae bacterium]